MTTLKVHNKTNRFLKYSADNYELQRSA